MNKIFYIMGKSASGKDKIYRKLLEMKNLKLHKLVLYTTRPRRDDEVDGREYYFVGEERLKEFEEQGRLIESRSYDTIHGVWTYFTADDGQLDLQKYDYIGIGTLESYEQMVRYFGREVMRPIYINVEDGERLSRALRREKKEMHPKYAEMCRRFLADCEDFAPEHILHAGIDYYFDNTGDLNECMKKIEKFIEDEQMPSEKTITCSSLMI